MSEQFPLLNACDPKQCLVSKVMKANRLMQQIFRKHLGHLDLTMSQLSVMFFISKKGNVSQSAIANTLHLEKSTVTRNLNRLNAKGYIVKSKPKAINASNKGKKMVEKAIPAWEKAMLETRKKIKPKGEKALDQLLLSLKN